VSRTDKEKAIQLLNNGHLEEAYKIFQDMHHKYPEDWIIYDGLAYLEKDLKGNLEESKKLIERSRELGCPEARYHRVCADILWSKGQLEQATLEFEKSVGADRSVDNLTVFANSLMKTNYERSVPIWKEIIKKDPSNALAYSGLAWIARKKTDWPLALEMATKAKEFQPKNPKVLFAIGQAYQGLGQCEQALKHYLEADEQDYRGKLLFHVNVAKCYIGLHNYAGALEQAYEAVKLNPQDSRVNELLNHCKDNLILLCDEQRYSEAYPLMVIALNICPDDSRLLAYMAILETHFKKNDELGKSYMHKAFEHNNADIDLLYMIKGCLWFDRLGDKKEGLACLEKAVSINRSNSNLVALAARLIDVDRERAQDIFDELFQSNPEHVDVIWGLAEIAMKEGKVVKGFELAKRAYDLKPSDSSINALLAGAHFSLGRYNEALQYYQKAAELGLPDKVYIYNSIAACYQKLGKLRKVRKYAKKALSINPDNPEAQNFLPGE